MSAKTLAELALKLWGLFLVVDAIISVPGTLAMLRGGLPDDPSQAAVMRATVQGYVLNIVVAALAGIALLLWARRIASKLNIENTALPADLSRADVEVLAFGIAGVFIFVSGLRGLASAVYTLAVKPDFVDTVSYMWPTSGEDITAGAVETTAGLLLVFGREGLARGWRRLRTGAADDRVEDQTIDDDDEAARDEEFTK